MEIRHCPRCDIDRDISDFAKNQYKCKYCQKEYRNNKNNKEKQKQYIKKYYKDNSEIIKNRSNIYYKNNKEIVLEKTKKYYMSLDPYKRWAYYTIKGHIHHGYIVNIDINYLIDLAKNIKYCPICKNEMICKLGNGHNLNSISLDRLHNENELNVNNIQIICNRCNMIKSNSTLEELDIWVEKYLEYRNKMRVL
jgi:hypothetical protein